MNNILTVSGAARILNMPENTVRDIERRGKLVAVRDSSGRRLFQLDEVERYAAERAAKKQQTE